MCVFKISNVQIIVCAILCWGQDARIEVKLTEDLLVSFCNWLIQDSGLWWMKSKKYFYFEKTNIVDKAFYFMGWQSNIFYYQCWRSSPFFHCFPASAPSKKARLRAPGSRFHKFILPALAPTKKVWLLTPGIPFRGFYRLLSGSGTIYIF